MERTMIEKIIDLSLKNRFLILICAFLLAGLSWWSIKKTPLDALPDLSPVQVIVQVKWEGQSPRIIEDQITYPLTSSFLKISDIETVRGFSTYENALIYIIFKDGTDMYWARDRVLEELSSINLPKEAEVTLGPDATGVGWVYEYALTSDKLSLAQLRTFQDYTLRYALLGIDGVSEVASIGGFIPNFEVMVKNEDLVRYHLSIKDLIEALRRNNNETGGRIVLQKGYEWIVQARGYVNSIQDIEKIVVKNVNKTPIRIKDIATVHLTAAPRRGMADLDGKGEVVGGIVVTKYGANAYVTIQKVKEKLKSFQTKEINIVPVYDRSDLIERSIHNLTKTLIEESLIVIVVVALFLFHLSSSLVTLFVLPLTIGLTFLLMKLFGIGSNIMSLGGIAIAIGAMVDASIVMIENVHKSLEKDPTSKNRLPLIAEATKKVGRPIFFALALVVISFFPIFALQGQEGKLFIPLAFTKTFAMSAGALLAVTLVPVLIYYFIRKVPKESANPINKLAIWLYHPFIVYGIKLRYIIYIALIALLAYTYPLYKKLKWEFMPPLDEGVLMYMPVTPYGIGIDLAKKLTQTTDRLIKEDPDVISVFGKAGRADTATDPAPLSMIETIIQLRPEHRPTKQIIQELDQKLQTPGLVNSWTYPIRGRIDMLLSGIRTPVGIKLYGKDPKILQRLARTIEAKLSDFERTESVFADKSELGYFYDIKLDEEKLARYGVDKSDILTFVATAIGGKKLTTFYKGIERYPISLRFDPKDRKDLERIKKLLIKTPYGYVYLQDLATIERIVDPSVIKTEDALPVTYIYITPKVSGAQYVKEAQKILSNIELPEGYYYEWAGESQYLDEAMQQLKFIIPLVLVIILILIYFALKEIVPSLIVFLSLPFAFLGGVWFVNYLDYNISVAVIVGFLALLGIAAETAIVMIVYLKESIEKMKPKSKQELYEAIYDGAVKRVRPKLMTVAAILAGLIPIMFSHEAGSEVMQRIAAPMIGGIVSSAFLSLILIPLLYYEYRKLHLHESSTIKE